MARFYPSSDTGPAPARAPGARPAPTARHHPGRGPGVRKAVPIRPGAPAGCGSSPCSCVSRRKLPTTSC